MRRVRSWYLAEWNERFLDLEDPRLAIGRQALNSRVVPLRTNWRGILGITDSPAGPMDQKTFEWLVIGHQATLVGADLSAVLASTGQYAINDSEYDTVSDALRFSLSGIVRESGFDVLDTLEELLAGEVSVIGSDFDWIITQGTA